MNVDMSVLMGVVAEKGMSLEKLISAIENGVAAAYAELPEAGYTWFPAESKNLMANALPLKFDDATVWFAFVVAIPPEDRTTFATLPVKVNDLVPTTTPL